MVAHLVRLRFLILFNGIKKSPWQLVGTILASLYGLFLLGMVVVGLIALSFAPIELARSIIVLGGAATIFGWCFAPLLATGIDQTVEPARLVAFPIPLLTLMLALTVSGVLGVAGIVTAVASFGTALAWLNHPLAALAALFCAVVAVLTCVVGSRTVIAISSRIVTGRRAREAKAVFLIVPLILLGPIIGWASDMGSVMDTSLPAIADVVAWTPFGAIWAVPADIAAGAFGPAAVRFVIAVATLAVLFLAWKPALRNAMENPVTSTRTKAGKNTAGAFGVFPATPTGAVAARAFTYWLRDPRYAQSLLVIPLIPVLAIFYTNLSGNIWLVNGTGPAVALLLALSIYTDVSYDSTAFALHLQTGVSGVADRMGRVIALAVFAVPLTVILTVGSVWYSNEWGALPGLLGISFGCLLSGFALSSVVSGRFAFAVPLPGESPFKSRPNGALALMLSTFGTWGALTILVLPELVLAIVGFVTGDIVWGWASLAVGLVLGGVFLVIGVRWGARILERRGPEMLVQLQAQK